MADTLNRATRRGSSKEVPWDLPDKSGQAWQDLGY